MLFILLIMVPFSTGLIYALLYSFGIIGFPHQGFTLLHWESVLSSGEVIRSFLFTVYIGIISLTIATLLALLYIIANKNRAAGTSYFIYLPLTIPAMVAAFFTFQFLSASGFVSRIFNALHLTKGIEGFPDLVNDSFGIGIAATHIMLALPFFILLFRNYYQSENIETLKELAFTLGASSSQFNLRILIPALLKKSLAPLALYFLFMLGSFEIPLLLGRQNPQMVSVLVNRKLNRFDLQQIPQGYIIVILYMLLVSLMLFIITKAKNRSHGQPV